MTAVLIACMVALFAAWVTVRVRARRQLRQAARRVAGVAEPTSVRALDFAAPMQRSASVPDWMPAHFSTEYDEPDGGSAALDAGRAADQVPADPSRGGLATVFDIGALRDGIAGATGLGSRFVTSARVRRLLDLAGNPSTWNPTRFLLAKVVGSLVGVVLADLIGSRHGFAWVLMLLVLLGGFGFVLPDLLLRIEGEKRQAELRRALPDAIDMLTLCSEAGLGFDSALARVAENMTGPVAQEFGRVLHEMHLGLPRSAALRAMTERTDVAELRAFVATIVQSSDLGIPLGVALREQSAQMRIQRRQRAEARAQQLQVKVLAPLIFCLLPAMFVVILGPAGLSILQFFGTMKQ